MCLFIDGLDEYEGDSIDHLYLARDLRKWSQHPNVKILCSARPHAEFIDTFNQSGKTIQIHEFTREDIYEFAYEMLKKEQDLRPGPVRLAHAELSSLVHEIVKLAEGVFLWACLVVRSLGSKMGIYRRDQLFKLLDQTPRQLHQLYESMLTRTDEAGRQRGDKMLMLTFLNPYDESLNAMTYSWLDDLEDPAFPSSLEARAMDESDIQAKLVMVKRELSDLTAGLLEMRQRSVDHRSEFQQVQFPFFRHCVSPIHRTVKEFILQNWITEKTHANIFKFITREVYFKLMLAELKSTVSMEYWKHNSKDDHSPNFVHFQDRTVREFGSLASNQPWLRKKSDVLRTQVGDDLLDQYPPLIRAYQDLLKRSGKDEYSALPTAGFSSIDHSERRQYSSTLRPSLVHLACHENHPEYVMRRLDACRQVQELDTASSNLLLISFYEDQCAVAQKVMSKGGRMNTKIEVKMYRQSEDAGVKGYIKSNHTVSIWLVMLRLLMIRLRSVQTYFRWGVRPIGTMATILIEALRYGENIDKDVVVLVQYTAYDAGSEYHSPLLRRTNITIDSEKDTGTTNGRGNMAYMDLEQVLDLWIIREGEEEDENGAKDVRLLKERLVASTQNNWQSSATKVWRGASRWLLPSKNNTASTSVAAEARMKYPRADLSQLKRSEFFVHGVLSSTESFLGDFWIASS
jgi:hypothetical protein